MVSYLLKYFVKYLLEFVGTTRRDPYFYFPTILKLVIRTLLVTTVSLRPTFSPIYFKIFVDGLRHLPCRSVKIRDLNTTEYPFIST